MHRNVHRTSSKKSSGEHSCPPVQRHTDDAIPSLYRFLYRTINEAGKLLDFQPNYRTAR